MPSFCETREALLLTYDQQFINDGEFVLLYDLNTSNNPYYPHWNYNGFNLDNLTDDGCKTDLRFYRSDVYRQASVMNILEQIKAPNRSTIDGIKAICVFLKHFSYLCRHLDLLPRFGRSVPELSMMSVLMQNHIYANYSHLLHDFNQPLLSPASLQEYSTYVHEKGAPLQSCFGVICGTVQTTMQTRETPKDLIQLSQTRPHNKTSIS